MKIFLTGATGFVGQKLAIELLNQGHQLSLFSRRDPADNSLNVREAKWIIGDFENLDILKRGMAGCEVVFHLAGFTKIWSRDPDEAYRTNVLGTKLMLKAAQEVGVTNFIYTSTAGIFGHQIDSASIQEDQGGNRIVFTSYEKSKSEATLIVQASASSNFRTIVLCPTRVFGPGKLSSTNQVTRMIRNYSKGRLWFIPGGNAVIGNYVFIDDVVNAHIQAINSGKSGGAYLIGGENLSLKGLFKVVGDCIQKNYRLIPLPIWALYGFAWLNDGIAAIFRRKPIITTAWVKKYLGNAAIDCSRAARELNYRPRPFRRAIEETLAWLNHELD